MPLPPPPARPAALLDLASIKTRESSQPAPAAKPARSAGTPPPEAKPRAPVAAPRPAVKPEAKFAPKPGARKPGLRQPLRKLFVLDTNVLLHDPSCLFRFEEHDVYLPMMTLEELDQHKQGASETARNARQVSRWLDALVAQADADFGQPVGQPADLDAGVALNALGHKDACGRLRFQTGLQPDLQPGLQPEAGRADDQILAVVRALAAQNSAQKPAQHVVLVSKDINMRLKARTLGLAAEDYFNDRVIDDGELLYSGVLALPENFWLHHGKDMQSWQQDGVTYYRVTGPLCAQFLVNQFVYLDGSPPLTAQVREISGGGGKSGKQGRTAVLATLRDHSHGKNRVWGITARNREQNFALNLLMNPDCDFVTLLGQAGTGKTLLALAAGLAQVLETRRYSDIIMTRATVSVGEDIGFLPGSEEEKMLPWMGALEDNLEVLNARDGNTSLADANPSAALELIRSRIKIKAMNFMRGRTFLNKFLIIDEAQNLTPKQMKTLITRAGPGTKVVCLGNIAQIDTPWLTEGSSGLTYVVDRFKGWPHAGHVTLQRGERSRLADYAAEVL